MNSYLQSSREGAAMGDRYRRADLYPHPTARLPSEQAAPQEPEPCIPIRPIARRVRPVVQRERAVGQGQPPHGAAAAISTGPTSAAVAPPMPSEAVVQPTPIAQGASSALRHQISTDPWGASLSGVRGQTPPPLNRAARNPRLHGSRVAQAELRAATPPASGGSIDRAPLSPAVAAAATLLRLDSLRPLDPLNSSSRPGTGAMTSPLPRRPRRSAAASSSTLSQARSLPPLRRRAAHPRSSVSEGVGAGAISASFPPTFGAVHQDAARATVGAEAPRSVLVPFETLPASPRAARPAASRFDRRGTTGAESRPTLQRAGRRETTGIEIRPAAVQPGSRESAGKEARQDEPTLSWGRRAGRTPCYYSEIGEGPNQSIPQSSRGARAGSGRGGGIQGSRGADHSSITGAGGRGGGRQGSAQASLQPSTGAHATPGRGGDSQDSGGARPPSNTGARAGHSRGGGTQSSGGAGPSSSVASRGRSSRANAPQSNAEAPLSVTLTLPEPREPYEEMLISEISLRRRRLSQMVGEYYEGLGLEERAVEAIGRIEQLSEHLKHVLEAGPVESEEAVTRRTGMPVEYHERIKQVLRRTGDPWRRRDRFKRQLRKLVTDWVDDPGQDDLINQYRRVLASVQRDIDEANQSAPLTRIGAAAAAAAAIGAAGGSAGGRVELPVAVRSAGTGGTDTGASASARRAE